MPDTNSMSSSLRFELTTPVTDDRPVYLSGNFNNWYPDSDAFRLWPLGAGRFALDLPAQAALPDVLEYKYTRGGWDQAELDASGEVPPNRTSRRKSGIRRDFVPHWRWFGRDYNPDFLPKLGLLDTEFAMPQLETTRRIRVLLPYDYAHTHKRYPVLYLNDGQNLIGAGSEYGSWVVDRAMAILAARHHHEIIVVAIDHGAERRIQEFTPERTLAGTGGGRKYLNFIVQSLKPVIDGRFRTRPDAAHTGIGGSSLGGLISLYAGLLHPGVFGKLLVFSPSLWISKQVYDSAARFQSSGSTSMYLYAGEKESRSMVSSLNRLREALQQSPGGWQLRLQESINPKGKHRESDWAREFPKAVEWLFY